MNEEYDQMKQILDENQIKGGYIEHEEQIYNKQQEYIKNAQKKAEKGRHRVKQFMSGVAIAVIVAGTTYAVGDKITNNMEKDQTTIKVEEQENTKDLTKDISQEYYKSSQDIYSEYIDWIELNRSEGLEMTNSQESYNSFLKNYDQNLKDLEHNQLGYEGNAQGGRRAWM